MDELPSTEFRKRFARLTKATVVTVNGHPIGVWSPTTSGQRLDNAIDSAERAMRDFGTAYNSRPFTPVPKKR